MIRAPLRERTNGRGLSARDRAEVYLSALKRGQNPALRGTVYWRRFSDFFEILPMQDASDRCTTTSTS